MGKRCHPCVLLALQDEVIDSIAQGVSKLLASSMNSRSFATAKLSGTAGIAEQPTAAGAQQAERDAQAGPLQPTQPSYYRVRIACDDARQPTAPPIDRLPLTAVCVAQPEKLVRSDHRAQTMDAFVVSQPSATATAAGATRFECCEASLRCHRRQGLPTKRHISSVLACMQPLVPHASGRLQLVIEAWPLPRQTRSWQLRRRQTWQLNGLPANCNGSSNSSHGW